MQYIRDRADRAVSAAKTNEPIEMLFGWQTGVSSGPRKYELEDGEHWCHLANMTDRSVRRRRCSSLLQLPQQLVCFSVHAYMLTPKYSRWLTHTESPAVCKVGPVGVINGLNHSCHQRHLQHVCY